MTLDEQTRELYERVRALHAPFIERIESNSAPDSTSDAAGKPRVLVMPGAFHRQYSHTGADGKRVFDLASELSWPVERVDIPSLAPMARNAGALIEHLGRLGDQPVVLASLSKGGADVRAALARSDAMNVFRHVKTWINLSGIVAGTPLIAWLRARRLRCLGVRALLRIRGQRFADLEELGCAPAAPMVLPPNMRAIHVAGFPLVSDLSNDWARRAHARLAPLGPNDGGGIMLRDLLDLPGDIFPVWGADHYLNPQWDVRSILRNLIREAASGQTVCWANCS